MLAISGASPARFQSRTASSNCAAVKSFCKNVVLTGIGFTVLPDIMMMFSSRAETTCGSFHRLSVTGRAQYVYALETIRRWPRLVLAVRLPLT